MNRQINEAIQSRNAELYKAETRLRRRLRLRHGKSYYQQALAEMARVHEIYNDMLEREMIGLYTELRGLKFKHVIIDDYLCDCIDKTKFEILVNGNKSLSGINPQIINET